MELQSLAVYRPQLIAITIIPMTHLNTLLKLTPAYRDYIWGGEKLRPGHYPTAEVWGKNIIESGSLAGKRDYHSISRE